MGSHFVLGRYRDTSRQTRPKSRGVIIGNDPVGAADGILHTVPRNIGAGHIAPFTW